MSLYWCLWLLFPADSADENPEYSFVSLGDDPKIENGQVVQWDQIYLDLSFDFCTPFLDTTYLTIAAILNTFFSM